jgi:hypothetical protein
MRDQERSCCYSIGGIELPEYVARFADEKAPASSSAVATPPTK